MVYKAGTKSYCIPIFALELFCFLKRWTPSVLADCNLIILKCCIVAWIEVIKILSWMTIFLKLALDPLEL